MLNPEVQNIWSDLQAEKAEKSWELMSKLRKAEKAENWSQMKDQLEWRIAAKRTDLTEGSDRELEFNLEWRIAAKEVWSNRVVR